LAHPLPPPRPVFTADEAPQQAVASADPAIAIPSPSAAAEPAPVASPPGAPQSLLPPPAARPAPRQVASAAATAPVPDSPDAALDRLNAHFNSIDQMTARFVQRAQNGSVQEGTLALKRPGQFRFNYAPPSTLEIVSDGRSVAIRDKKLGTNDVYPVGQTPLKFLVQDKFNLARDTKVQDVRTSADGTVTVVFEDRATLGGTSTIELRFDARANRLKQWIVTDPQGFRTTIVLSDVNVVRAAAQ
jgi:outer membrane lipoprotein-sorting protein